MKKIVLCLVSLVLSIALYGQNTKKMNSIKRSPFYLYAEATMSTEQEAYETAKELLLIQVKEYVGGKKAFKNKDILIKDINQLNDSLQFRRGDMYKVFLYVKKNDIIKADNSVMIENNQEEVVSEVKDEHNEALPQEEKPVVIPEKDESLYLPVAWQQNVIDRLLSSESFSQAKALLSRMKAEFKVKQTGPFSTLRNNRDKYLLLGRDGLVLTVLGPDNNGRTDFAKLVKTSLDEYQDVEIVWFTLSK